MNTDFDVLIIEDTPEAAKLMIGLIKAVFPQAAICLQPTLQQALDCLNDKPWRLFLVDLGLPDGLGTTFIQQAKCRFADTPFIVMTVFDDDDNLFGALTAGATGYLLKHQPRNQLLQQLTLIQQGHVPMSPSIAQRVLQYFRENTGTTTRPHTPPDNTAHIILSAREKEVLTAIAKGLRNREVAELLGLTEQTISTYVRNLYAKLNICNRAQATLAAQQHGLL